MKACQNNQIILVFMSSFEYVVEDTVHCGLPFKNYFEIHQEM